MTVKSSTVGWAAVFAVISATGRAPGETLLLNQGGTITGEIQNPSEIPRKTYVVKTPEGAVVTLDHAQVKQVLRQRPAEAEYEKIRPRYPDTVAGQWELADWCREKNLLAQRKVHLQRLLELDPNHKQARLALGYTWKDGRWSTQEELMKARGLELYRGRWLTRQEIEVLEEKQKQQKAEKEWIRTIEAWRSWLDTDRGRGAREKILEIKDPAAVQGLARALEASGDSPKARVLFAKALAGLGTAEAKRKLASCALLDPDEDVRATCLNYLKKVKDTALVEFFIARLRDPNVNTINRAAVALKEMEDRSAIGPLIDALVTVHKRKVPNPAAGQINPMFGSGPGGGGGGLSVGGPKYRILRERSENRSVLEALAALTGVNYGFNVEAWRSWYAAQRNRETIEARRGS